MTMTQHLSREALDEGLEDVLRSPHDAGALELIVRRPETGAREVVDAGELDPAEGLVGDNWKTRGSAGTPDGSAHFEMQLNVMNSRAIALIAQTTERWALAGDQLFVDLDLSEQNLPVGTRLGIGAAVIEVTPPPHAGCQKFVERFGVDAMKWVNSDVGRGLRLRGLNARVIQAGVIHAGDTVTKIA